MFHAQTNKSISSCHEALHIFPEYTVKFTPNFIGFGGIIRTSPNNGDICSCIGNLFWWEEYHSWQRNVLFCPSNFVPVLEMLVFETDLFSRNFHFWPKFSFLDRNFHFLTWIFISWQEFSSCDRKFSLWPILILLPVTSYSDQEFSTFVL